MHQVEVDISSIKIPQRFIECRLHIVRVVRVAPELGSHEDLVAQDASTGDASRNGRLGAVAEEFISSEAKSISGKCLLVRRINVPIAQTQRRVYGVLLLIGVLERANAYGGNGGPSVQCDLLATILG